MSLLSAGFLASRLLGIALFARFDVDALLVGAAAVGALVALVALVARRGYARSDAAGRSDGERGDEVESCR